ncbi:MAG: mechanosensitive ion channel domain-containing protein [Clostridiales bacterium]
MLTNKLSNIINSKNIFNSMIDYGLKILMAIIIIFVGTKIIKIFTNFISKNFIKKKVDISLQSFIISIIRILLYLLLSLLTAQTVGIHVTSFIAVLASVSFAIGLALQGSLSNFAGGIIILLLKPFKVGDYIQPLNVSGLATDISGTVCEIQIFHTILNTDENVRIIIPNSNLSNCSTINFTTNETRRLELKIYVDIKEDVSDIKNILTNILKEDPFILNEPIFKILLSGYNQKTLTYILRAWCNTKDYWDIYYALLEKIRTKLEKRSITVSNNTNNTLRPEDDDEYEIEDEENNSSDENNDEVP